MRKISVRNGIILLNNRPLYQRLAEEFLKRFGSLFEAVRNIGYLSGYCYTQLYDVMQEVNGLATADRKLKVRLDKIRNIIVKEAEK